MRVKLLRSLSRSVAVLPLLAACATDDVIGNARQPETGTFVVDASSAWQYVSLTDSALVTPSPSAAESDAWDIAFFATNVMLNGGVAGPGDVEATCLCQNAAATDEMVLAMTAESERADFNAVASVPAGLTWASERLTPAIAEWFAGSGAAATAAPDNSWLVRLANGTGYAKLRVTSIVSPSATHAGQVTLEFATQPDADSPLGEVRSLTVDLSAGAALVDLTAGATTTSATAWDLKLDGFTIRTNGGVSGTGGAGAALAEESFESTTTAATDARAYRTDAHAGVFADTPYYRYNILGDHRISPTFDVYLLRRAGVTYKLQVTGYYGATGTSRQISFRWEKIDG